VTSYKKQKSFIFEVKLYQFHNLMVFRSLGSSC